MLVSCLVAARFLAELQPHFWHMSPCHICNYRTRAIQLHWKHFSQNWIYLSSERAVRGPTDGHTARPLIILNACHQIDRSKWLPQPTMWAHSSNSFVKMPYKLLLHKRIKVFARPLAQRSWLYKLAIKTRSCKKSFKKYYNFATNCSKKVHYTHVTDWLNAHCNIWIIESALQ